MTNNLSRENDQHELNDLKSFTKTQGWNLLPKRDKEEIVRRIRWLEQHLGVESKPYNES